MCTHTGVKNGPMAISFQWEGEEVRKVPSQNFLDLGMRCSGSQEIDEHQQEKQSSLVSGCHWEGEEVEWRTSPFWGIAGC